MEAITVKGRQVRRYYTLLGRLGFDNVFDQLSAAVSAPPPTPGPTQPGEMTTSDVAVMDVNDIRIDLDLGRIMRACCGTDGAHGATLNAFDELAAAVLDLDDETAAAGAWSVAEVEERYGPFCEASAGLLKRLMKPQFGLA